MKKYYVKWAGIIVICACIIGIGLFIRNMKTEMNQEQTDTRSEQNQEQENEQKQKIKTGDVPYYRISLSEKYDGQVTVEENLVEKAIHVNFTNISSFLFSAIIIEESDSRIIKTEKNYDNGTGSLIIRFDDMYVCDMSQEDGQISLSFQPIREKYDRIIVIDPGHGGVDDTGTIAYGFEEKELALDLSKELKKAIEMEDSETFVCLTRVEDTSLSQKDREAFAAQIKADLYISVHMNADASSRATTGAMVYYAGEDITIGKQYAESMQKSIAAATNQKETGIPKKNADIISETFSVPAVVVEAGYMTNKQEAMKLGTKEYRGMLIEGIIGGINQIWERQ